ncbi:MAG: hypothetical protein P4M00_01275 [Azospirillaceae bacterium]|nr:hypothetical protein [Azospirillaceae bacterium]
MNWTSKVISAVALSLIPFGGARADWQPDPAARQTVFIGAKMLATLPTKVEVSQSDKDNGRKETITVGDYDDVAHPYAQVISWSATKPFETWTTKEAARLFVDDPELDLDGDPKTVAGRYGRIEYIAFKNGETACLYLQGAFNGKHNLLEGVLCAALNSPLSAEDAKAFAASIEIRP